jgi:predicted acylesterase/phospholipase RssA
VILCCYHMRTFCFLIIAALFGRAADAQGCRPGSTALVLSGGGAKGLAHIGVLRVMDSLGIRPDLVVGSSMGAIVGAMYASGYSGREIDSLARSLPLTDLFRTYQPRAPRSLGILQPLVVWEQGSRRFNLQSASVSESKVNSLVNAALLRGNLLARGNFDSLPIRFRAVAANLADRSAVVIDSGDLARAVRASIAIPFLFAPESLGGQILADGGLAANIPVAAARAAGAERVIVSDATERLADSVDLFSPIVLADRLLGFLFQQPADSLLPGDILIRPAVEGFTGLNFSPAKVASLIRRGSNAAEGALNGRDECLPRYALNMRPSLPRRITRVVYHSDNPSERLALSRLLGLSLSDTLVPTLLRGRVRNLATSEAYQAVWLAPHGAGDSVSFEVSARRAARRVAGLGLAYDNELGGRMWVGAVDRRLLALSLEGSAAVFLGEFRKDLSVGLRRNYQLGHQLMTPTLSLQIGSESVRQFASDGDELDPLETREVLGFLGLERGFEPGWLVSVGLSGHDWDEPRRETSTVGATAKVTRVGRSRSQVFEAEFLWNGVYRRAVLDGEAGVVLGGLRLRPRLRLAWGDRLPLQATIPLGGADGFPGLHLDERRGDRETFASVLLTYGLKGPFVGRLEVAAGRSGLGGPFLDDRGWLAGARVGIGADTPVGPIRFEYGRTTTGRGAIFVRLGQWF